MNMPEAAPWQHWGAMVGVCRGIVDTVDDAYDCAADALAQVIGHGQRDVVNLEAFLVTVAKRRAIDRVRKQSCARRRHARLAAQADVYVPDPADLVASRAEAKWIDQKARELLSPQAYRLLQLVAEGRTTWEIAAILEISPRAAESKLLRARRTVVRACRIESRKLE